MSRRQAKGGGASGPSWADVDRFLEMAADALRQRTEAAEQLAAKLTVTNARLEQEIREKGEVARQGASASEDSSFLAAQVQALMVEKQELKGRVQQLERERAFLQEEVQLLRSHLLLEGSEGQCEEGLESPLRGVPASPLHLQEELLCERQRSAELECEAQELRARVAALERANKMQHMALLGCIEESERAQQAEHGAAGAAGGSTTRRSLAKLQLFSSVPGSPADSADTPAATADTWAQRAVHSEGSADYDSPGAEAGSSSSSPCRPGEAAAGEGSAWDSGLPAPGVDAAVQGGAP